MNKNMNNGKLKEKFNKGVKILPIILGLVVAPVSLFISLKSNLIFQNQASTLYLGSGNVIATFGKEGDGYIDSKTNNSYQKQNSEWTLVENIITDNKGFSYNLFKINNHSYRYDTTRWVEDYKNNSLNIPYACRIDFDSCGGTFVNSQMVVRNEKIIEPRKPNKVGKIFTHWTCNGVVWDFYNDTAYISTCLVAVWK